MPIYEFQCQGCGLAFEKIVPRMTGDQEAQCQCGATAGRIVSRAAFAFAHTPTGPVPQNTGVHGIDYNPDQVIGRDAAEKWKLVEERNKEKEKVKKEAAKEGKIVDSNDQLVKTRDGAYRPIQEPERKIVNEHREAAFKISQMISKQTKKDE